MTPLKILLAFTAMMSLLMVFSIQRIPGDEPIVVPTPSIPAADAQTTVVPKSEARVVDMSKPMALASTEPKPVVTERVVPDAPERAPPVAAVEEDEQPAVRRVRRARAESNICTRHGKRKVMTRGGRSWRCR